MMSQPIEFINNSLPSTQQPIQSAGVALAETLYHTSNVLLGNEEPIDLWLGDQRSISRDPLTALSRTVSPIAAYPGYMGPVQNTLSDGQFCNRYSGNSEYLNDPLGSQMDFDEEHSRFIDSQQVGFGITNAYSERDYYRNELMQNASSTSLNSYPYTDMYYPPYPFDPTSLQNHYPVVSGVQGMNYPCLEVGASGCFDYPQTSYQRRQDIVLPNIPDFQGESSSLEVPRSLQNENSFSLDSTQPKPKPKPKSKSKSIQPSKHSKNRDRLNKSLEASRPIPDTKIKATYKAHSILIGSTLYQPNTKIHLLRYTDDHTAQINLNFIKACLIGDEKTIEIMLQDSENTGKLDLNIPFVIKRNSSNNTSTSIILSLLTPRKCRQESSLDTQPEFNSFNIFHKILEQKNYRVDLSRRGNNHTPVLHLAIITRAIPEKDRFALIQLILNHAKISPEQNVLSMTNSNNQNALTYFQNNSGVLTNRKRIIQILKASNTENKTLSVNLSLAPCDDPSRQLLPSHETRSTPLRIDTHRDSPASRILPLPTSNQPVFTHEPTEDIGNRKRKRSQVSIYSTKQSKLDRSHS